MPAELPLTGGCMCGGVRVEMPLPLLFSVRAGKISEWHMFAHAEEGLKAAGLEE